MLDYYHSTTTTRLLSLDYYHSTTTTRLLSFDYCHSTDGHHCYYITPLLSLDCYHYLCCPCVLGEHEMIDESLRVLNADSERPKNLHFSPLLLLTYLNLLDILNATADLRQVLILAVAHPTIIARILSLEYYHSTIVAPCHSL